jgi:ketosteroid isomerase-like protein
VLAANAPGTPEQVRQDLIRIEREIGQANFDCDYKYFAKVEAEEFVFTDASGGLTTRKEDLAGEKNCRKSEGSYVLDETLVSVYGNTAVLTSRATTSGRNKDGSAFSRKNRFTDVFVWRDGRWQLVAGHSSRIPDEKKK